MKKQTKFLIFLSSLLTFSGILLSVAPILNVQQDIVKGETMNCYSRNQILNDVIPSVQQQPIEIDLSALNYAITDFYNNCSTQFEAIKKNIANISAACGIPISFSEITNVEPDFMNNWVIVTTTSMQTYKLVGFNKYSLRITNVQQPISQENNLYPSRINVELPRECNDWKMNDPSTWVNCNAYGVEIPNDINAKYEWLLNYITNYLYEHKPVIWDGVTYFNAPNIFIVENVGSLMNATISMNLLETNPQTLKTAISNSYNFKEVGSEYTDPQHGLLRLSFYLKNYISYDSTTNGYILNTISTPSEIKNNLQKYNKLRLDIELTGFYTPDNIKNSQKMGDEQIDILIIVLSSVGGGIILLLVFFIVYKYLLNLKYGKANHE